jgi:hypothetical protein
MLKYIFCYFYLENKKLINTNNYTNINNSKEYRKNYNKYWINEIRNYVP